MSYVKRSNFQDYEELSKQLKAGPSLMDKVSIFFVLFRYRWELFYCEYRDTFLILTFSSSADNLHLYLISCRITARWPKCTDCTDFFLTLKLYGLYRFFFKLYGFLSWKCTLFFLTYFSKLWMKNFKKILKKKLF